MKARTKTIAWLEDVEEHDYPATASNRQLLLIDHSSAWLMQPQVAL